MAYLNGHRLSLKSTKDSCRRIFTLGIRPISSTNITRLWLVFPLPCHPEFLRLTVLMEIGGSYATIPRLAERRTLRNYYQHNYPYAWVGARVAYDV